MIKTQSRENTFAHLLLDFNNPKNRSLQRLTLLKKLGLFGNRGKLSFARVSSFRDLKTAYSLNYRIFLKNNYISPNFLGMRIREWELNPETATFVAYDKRQIVGTITLAPEIKGLGLPSEELYTNEIRELRRASRFLAEACNASVEESYRNHSTISEYFRLILTYSWYFGIDKFIAVTNKGHKSFYEFLYMVQIGGEKSYSDQFYDPVVLMCLDCDLLREYLSSPASDNGTADAYLRDFLLYDNPYMALMPKWDRQAGNSFIRQRIRERFLDEMKNSLIESVFGEPRFEASAGQAPPGAGRS